jgi:hypothetical protein
MATPEYWTPEPDVVIEAITVLPSDTVSVPAATPVYCDGGVRSCGEEQQLPETVTGLAHKSATDEAGASETVPVRKKPAPRSSLATALT